MYFIICYDIANPKRLEKVSKICENYGIRLQKSCFQVSIEKTRIQEIMKAIKKAIKLKEDSIICYSVCEDCYKKIETDGTNSILKQESSIFL